MKLILPDSPGAFLAACGRADQAARFLARFGQPRPSLAEELDDYEALARIAPPEIGRDYLRLEPWSAPVRLVVEDLRRSGAP